MVVLWRRGPRHGHQLGWDTEETVGSFKKYPAQDEGTAVRGVFVQPDKLRAAVIGCFGQAVSKPMESNNEFRSNYGKWAMVTGASSGIGRAMVQELAKVGLNLVLVARREAELKQLAAEMSASHGVQTRVLSADLSIRNEVQRIEKETFDLDIGLLVAAAGFGTSGDFIDANLEDELSMLDVNCRAVMELSLHFGRRLVKRGGGGMILFGSLVGYQGTPRAAHYAATKAYVQTFAEGLHLELAPMGVHVLASAPGPVLSGFGKRAKMQMGLAEKPERVARATLAALGKRMTVTPGVVSKFLTWSLMTAPRGLRVRIMGRIMGGMTRPREGLRSRWT